jgi:hypothetical protein
MNGVMGSGFPGGKGTTNGSGAKFPQVLMAPLFSCYSSWFALVTEGCRCDPPHVCGWSRCFQAVGGERKFFRG